MSIIKHTLTNLYQKASSFTLTVPSAIILGALIIAVSHISYAYVLRGAVVTTPTSVFTGKAITDKDFPTGNTISEVIVVEYSDTECPFCAQLHPTIESLQKEYASKVTFVYRYFPLTQIHPNAFEEARAIFCVGKISGADKRGEYIDAMFNYKLGNKNMTLPKNGKEDLAKNLGVNEKELSLCLRSEESKEAVSDSIKDGVTAGVEGTPATFILKKTNDGYDVVSLIGGAQSYDYFKAAIDEALSR